MTATSSTAATSPCSSVMGRASAVTNVAPDSVNRMFSRSPAATETWRLSVIRPFTEMVAV